ncbi:MAG: hypothetical protein S4CHLAM102_09080 [Chlamydiia bacterium]|nr:hypothetical protein [Chlamydiia bacterium]
MQAKDRLKMCPQCEGNVSFEAKVCPYCGTNLELAQQHAPASTHEVSSLQDHLESLYRPPYMVKTETPNRPTEQTEAPPEPEANPQPGLFQDQLDLFTYDSYESEEEAPSEESSSPFLKQLLPILLLSFGAQLFILAFMLLLFSDHGRVVLEWKSRYWLLYLLTSLPALYFGYMYLKDD